MPLKIVTVLNVPQREEAGEYKLEHAVRLHGQLRPMNFTQLCLTNSPSALKLKSAPFISVPFQESWPGWWAKIEAFRVPGPVLYLDLDTTIQDYMELKNALEELITDFKTRFVTLRDFNFPVRNVQSSMMFWQGDMLRVFSTFRARANEYMAEYTTKKKWGDQGFIEDHFPPNVYIQDLFPALVASYKKEVAKGIMANAPVVIFHGKPRPWEIDHAA